MPTALPSHANGDVKDPSGDGFGKAPIDANPSQFHRRLGVMRTQNDAACSHRNVSYGALFSNACGIDVGSAATILLQ
jgi:hypothetical protein